MIRQQSMPHSIESSTLADVLDRVLDKGIVIAGDIKIKLVDIELLSIQIRLLICSVDKAKEIGIDWWVNNPFLSQRAVEKERERQFAQKEEDLEALKKRIEQLESSASGNRHSGDGKPQRKMIKE